MKENVDILVVDDDPGLRRLLEKRLSAAGYEVLMAANGIEGVKLARHEDPDLILLDVLMPLQDGYKACEEIKKVYRQDIPIIIFTGQPYEKELINEAYKEFGADDYLLKPLDMEELLKKVKKLIKKYIE